MHAWMFQESAEAFLCTHASQERSIVLCLQRWSPLTFDAGHTSNVILSQCPSGSKLSEK